VPSNVAASPPQSLVLLAVAFDEHAQNKTLPPTPESLTRKIIGLPNSA
jgi:hypothetical protein